MRDALDDAERTTIDAGDAEHEADSCQIVADDRRDDRERTREDARDARDDAERV